MYASALSVKPPGNSVPEEILNVIVVVVIGGHPGHASTSTELLLTLLLDEPQHGQFGIRMTSPGFGISSILVLDRR